MLLVAVLAAGGAGAATRYLVDGAIQDRSSGAFPWGTFVINLSGSLALGVVAGLVLSRSGLPDPWRAVLGTGFVGAYTTFSTWMFETLALLRSAAWRYAALNLIGSAAAGVLLAWAGLWLGGVR